MKNAYFWHAAKIWKKYKIVCISIKPEKIIFFLMCGTGLMLLWWNLTILWPFEISHFSVEISDWWAVKAGFDIKNVIASKVGEILKYVKMAYLGLSLTLWSYPILNMEKIGWPPRSAHRPYCLVFSRTAH